MCCSLDGCVWIPWNGQNWTEMSEVGVCFLRNYCSSLCLKTAVSGQQSLQHGLWYQRLANTLKTKTRWLVVPDIWKSFALWKVPSLRPFVLLIKSSIKVVSVEQWWNGTDRGNRSAGRKARPIATWSTTNVTGNGLVSNPGLRGEKLSTNRLSQGTAKRLELTWIIYKDPVRTAQ
jgi:hypothetical protein